MSPLSYRGVKRRRKETKALDHLPHPIGVSVSMLGIDITELNIGYCQVVRGRDVGLEATGQLEEVDKVETANFLVGLLLQVK